jgi:hypothetical protein
MSIIGRHASVAKSGVLSDVMPDRAIATTTHTPTCGASAAHRAIAAHDGISTRTGHDTEARTEGSAAILDATGRAADAETWKTAAYTDPMNIRYDAA